MSIVEAKGRRFEFGRNWRRYARHHLDDERVALARNHILSFLKQEDLRGIDFLDIGCGSGINCVAAISADARSVYAFDFDADSVATTKAVLKKFAPESNWRADRGDVLDDEWMAKLGKWSLVYAWGVLHHTGDVWKAIDKSCEAVADGGLFYLALYSADTHSLEIQKYWLSIKREYSAASWSKRVRMYCWHIWHHVLVHDPIRALMPTLRDMWQYKRKNRGMSMLVDIHDWLGGWPMEFTKDADVIEFLRQRGFELSNINAGGSLTEFLFTKSANHASTV